MLSYQEGASVTIFLWLMRPSTKSRPMDTETVRLGAFKADMSKAYAESRWDFLEAVLVRYGFPKTFDYAHDELRDDVLSRNIDHAHNLRLIHGIQLVRGVRPITHLFFADDSVFFFKDKGDTVTRLVQLIQDYCEASGQRLNVDKSGILFSPSTTLVKAQKIMKDFNIRKNNGIGKYLGIPAEFKESKQGIFNALIDHVTRRISSWNGIFLSPAGRLTLISSVLSNLSNYFLSVFKVPVSVAKKINSILAQFWWTGCKMGHNIHWCSKNFLSLPKSVGGLGIRNVKCLNQALLAKLGWRIVSGESSLFCRIFRQKLFGSQVVLQGMTPIRGNGCSWGIRSILHGLSIVMENIGWKPGIDSRLNVWTARWVGGERPEPRIEWLNHGNSHLANLQMWKILIWKIITNVIPTGQEFSKRNIEVDFFCGSLLGIRVEGARGTPISDWIYDWIYYLSKREEGMCQVVHFVAVLWGLWTMRNRIKFQDQVVQSHLIANMFYNVVGERAKILCNDLASKQAQNDRRSENDGSSQREIMAIRNGNPVHIIGRVLDAAFGWVAYDDTGQELGRRQVRTRAESPLQAEALGVRDIVEWAREERIYHLDISSDCLQLIIQIAEVDRGSHMIEGILEDIRNAFSFFHCLCFSFIPRHLNGLAHSLAKQAIKL
ncbi:uncharacterized protein LOC141617013 [Silene latifolia]|uniref:uncharacterized protein LOC141617013 n=1 Tax=Silene latifolia TaxID=37657 RepID=UPI003D7763AF